MHKEEGSRFRELSFLLLNYCISIGTSVLLSLYPGRGECTGVFLIMKTYFRLNASLIERMRERWYHWFCLANHIDEFPLYNTL